MTILNSTAIQNRINELTAGIQGGGSDFQLTEWETELEQKKADLINALNEEAQQQERVQAQAEKIEAITLPYDYNEILGNPMANETIIENVKQFQLQAYEEHNAEVARIKEEHKTALDNLYGTYQDAVTQHTEDRDDLQNRIELLQDKFDDLNGLLGTALMEKGDAEDNRDNAARLLEEAIAEVEKHKQSTIENCELRKEIEDLKLELTAKKAITVSGNEKLAELAAKAKESTAAAAQRGIDRWNQQYGMDIPTIEAPEVQPVNAVLETVEAVQQIPFQEEVQASDNGEVQGDQGNESLHEVVSEESQVVTLASLKEEVETLKNRLTEIESHIPSAA